MDKKRKIIKSVGNLYMYNTRRLLCLPLSVVLFVVQAMRLFVGEPVWTPLNRPQDDHPIRKDYLQNFAATATTAAT